MFRLDRNGGRDKIAKATYSPKAYRRENARPEQPSTLKTVLAWTLIFGTIFGVMYMVENHNAGKPLLPLDSISAWLENMVASAPNLESAA